MPTEPTETRHSRRRFLKASAVAASAAGLSYGGFSAWKSRGESSYRAALRSLHRPPDLGARGADAVLEIARYATMAANSHNTQPWRFAVGPGALRITPDASRRCGAVDPADHHLFVSLGCASENALQAAPAFGLCGAAGFDPSGRAIALDFRPGPRVSSELFGAIPRRRSTRAPFDGSPLADGELDALRVAARQADTELTLFARPDDLRALEDFVVRANRIQMADAAFVHELKHWVRYSYAEAVESGDGLFGKSSGSPVVPAWVGGPLFDSAFTVGAETAKYRALVRSSAGIAVFVGREQTPPNWAGVGRGFQRFALTATSLGVLHSHLNQPVEVPAVRAELAEWLKVGDRRPDLVVRFGRGQPLLPSLRRPVAETLSLA